MDANVLIAGIRVPRWPHEVMRAALGESFDLILPVQVIAEARRHLALSQREVLDDFLSSSGYEEWPMPAPDRVSENAGLVRSWKDTPIALALLDGMVDIFVTNDRDFTEPTATAAAFQERVRVMLPAVFLREVLGWHSQDLEAIRTRQWRDFH